MVLHDRAPFLGHSVRPSRLHAQTIAPCRAVPSDQPTAPCRARLSDRATAPCRALPSAQATSALRQRQQHQHLMLEQRHVGEPPASAAYPEPQLSMPSTQSPDQASARDILCGMHQQTMAEGESVAEAGSFQRQGTDMAQADRSTSVTHAHGMHSHRVSWRPSISAVQLTDANRQQSSRPVDSEQCTVLCLQTCDWSRSRQRPIFRQQWMGSVQGPVPIVGHHRRVPGRQMPCARFMTDRAHTMRRPVLQGSSSQPGLLAQDSALLSQASLQVSIHAASRLQGCSKLLKLGRQPLTPVRRQHRVFF